MRALYVRELKYGDRRRPNAQRFGYYARDVLMSTEHMENSVGRRNRTYCTVLLYVLRRAMPVGISRARMYGPLEKNAPWWAQNPASIGPPLHGSIAGTRDQRSMTTAYALYPECPLRSLRDPPERMKSLVQPTRVEL